MRFWLGMIVSSCLLFALGGLVAVWDQSADDSLNTAVQLSRPAFYPKDQPQPKAVLVGEPMFDFGTQEVSTTSSHQFLIRNEGEADLILGVGETTSRSIFPDFAQPRIPPGGEEWITVEWAIETSLEYFRESTTLLTNDRQMPSIPLTIKGRIAKLLETKPDHLILEVMMADQINKVDFALYSKEVESFEVLKHEFKTVGLDRYFSAEFIPLQVRDLERLDAQGGYRAIITIQPGMDLGRFDQVLQIETNIANRAPIEYNIRGTFQGKLSLLGGQGAWDPKTGILDLGLIRSSRGINLPMKLVVRDPENTEVKIEEVFTYPKDGLEVTVGERERLGEFYAYPLTIKIPRGTKNMNYLSTNATGRGEIYLRTNHPETPNFLILVEFAVVEQ
ncbi:Hypothetical protein PBC10988_39740 [Planctomycetales bacterium 10988]|nr:Hypothetical protein PBC10988_39740 [Planctomycetales bacterium 10988]